MWKHINVNCFTVLRNDKIHDIFFKEFIFIRNNSNIIQLNWSNREFNTFISAMLGKIVKMLTSDQKLYIKNKKNGKLI